MWGVTLSLSPAETSGEALKDTGPHLAKEAVLEFFLEIFAFFYLWVL